MVSAIVQSVVPFWTADRSSIAGAVRWPSDKSFAEFVRGIREWQGDPTAWQNDSRVDRGAWPGPFSAAEYPVMLENCALRFGERGAASPDRRHAQRPAPLPVRSRNPDDGRTRAVGEAGPVAGGCGSIWHMGERWWRARRCSCRAGPLIEVPIGSLDCRVTTLDKRLLSGIGDRARRQGVLARQSVPERRGWRSGLSGHGQSGLTIAEVALA